MRKILALVGVSLLIGEMFSDTNNVGAMMLPYFRHQRYPFRKELQQPLIIIRTAPDNSDMDRYISGRTVLTQKRSQPDTDFDYTDDFDPTHIFF